MSLFTLQGSAPSRLLLVVGTVSIAAVLAQRCEILPKMSLVATQADLTRLMTDSQPFWPADGGEWHRLGPKKVSDLQ